MTKLAMPRPRTHKPKPGKKVKVAGRKAAAARKAAIDTKGERGILTAGGK